MSPSRAIEIQRELAGRVRFECPRGVFRRVAGIDVAFSRDGASCIAGAVVWDVREGSVVEERTAVRPLRFPYVPGLLSFREAPAVLAALRKLRTVPDALLCDGHGYAHPRRFGLACHVGLVVDLPALGCAKGRLCGEHREPGDERGATVPLVHRGEVVGSVLRTRTNVRPVFVSAGHRIDLSSAERLVLDCAKSYRLPEPTRRADILVAEAKRKDRRAGEPGAGS